MDPDELDPNLARRVGIRARKSTEREPKEKAAEENSGRVPGLDQKAGLRSMSDDEP